MVVILVLMVMCVFSDNYNSGEDGFQVHVSK